jgi:hypothetical protein
MINKSICKKHGCDFEENYFFSDTMVQICVSCGRRLTYPVYGGKHDEKRYGYENRRVFIQPGNTLATYETRRDEQWAVDLCKGEIVAHQGRENKSRRFSHRDSILSA